VEKLIMDKVASEIALTIYSTVKEEQEEMDRIKVSFLTTTIKINLQTRSILYVRVDTLEVSDNTAITTRHSLYNLLLHLTSLDFTEVLKIRFRAVRFGVTIKLLLLDSLPFLVPAETKKGFWTRMGNLKKEKEKLSKKSRRAEDEGFGLRWFGDSRGGYRAYA
jgi:hypothetical protein